MRFHLLHLRRCHSFNYFHSIDCGCLDFPLQWYGWYGYALQTHVPLSLTTSHKPVSGQVIEVDSSVAARAFAVTYVVELPRSRLLARINNACPKIKKS